jgi:hypothetical protein
MVLKYTSNFHRKTLQNLPKFTQIGVFGLETSGNPALPLVQVVVDREEEKYFDFFFQFFSTFDVFIAEAIK